MGRGDADIDIEVDSGVVADGDRPAAPRIGRKALQIALSRIPDHPAPDTTREQVKTPGNLAADILLAAADEDHVHGRRVVDLGCGTGVFAIGAALLGAARVVGVDVDEAAMVEARRAAEMADVSDRVHFEVADLRDVTPDALHEWAGGPVDTVLMNPPFGADQRSRARGGDRVFLSLAFRAAPVVLSLHLAETQGFLVAFARDAGRTVDTLGTVAFPIPARFAHHREEVRTVPVGIYRFQRAGASTA